MQRATAILKIHKPRVKSLKNEDKLYEAMI